MVAGLSSSATAVINADDEFAPLWRGSTAARVVTFGLRGGADFCAEGVRASVGAEGFRSDFRLNAPQGSADIRLALAGTHNVVNALAAAAAAASAGASLDADQRRARRRARGARAAAVAGRPAAGAWLIDDSYNANPSSMHAAHRGARAACRVAGGSCSADMAELGAFAADVHARDR